ncbi:MAG: hypothetical protein ACQES4_09770, partial [Bacillota bacterium]
MPSIKALSFALLVIALSFSLIGCGIINSFTSSTDEVVEVGGQVPEWLQLSHRSIASEDNDREDDLAAIDEEDEEEEEEETDQAVGGVDEEDEVTADSANGDTEQNEQATSEVAQAAETGSSESTEQQESSGGSTFDEMVAKIKPGKPEYSHYLLHREDSTETPEEFVRRALKAKEEDEKAESQGSMMDDFD